MYSISKDKLPDAPKKPIVEKLPVPPPPIPESNGGQVPIVENITQGVQTSTVIILAVLVVVIIIAIGVGIYLFIEKDKEITNLTKELTITKNQKSNRVNDITCDCPEIPECPVCPEPPQCPTTICPDCPTTNDIVNSIFPGRSTLDYDNTNDPQYGNKDMEILDDKDVDADNQKKYLVDQSLDIDKNYKELKKQIEGIIGKPITSK